MLFKPGNQGNVSALGDDAHWEIGVVERADDREENIKTAHGFRGMLMIFGLYSKY